MKLHVGQEIPELIKDPTTRQKLQEWFAAPRIPLEKVKLSSVPAQQYRHLEGLALEAAETHLAASLPHVTGDYMGEHWLATFALLALI